MASAASPALPCRWLHDHIKSYKIIKAPSAAGPTSPALSRAAVEGLIGLGWRRPSRRPRRSFTLPHGAPSRCRSHGTVIERREGARERGSERGRGREKDRERVRKITYRPRRAALPLSSRHPCVTRHVTSLRHVPRHVPASRPCVMSCFTSLRHVPAIAAASEPPTHRDSACRHIRVISESFPSRWPTGHGPPGCRGALSAEPAAAAMTALTGQGPRPRPAGGLWAREPRADSDDSDDSDDSERLLGLSRRSGRVRGRGRRGRDRSRRRSCP